MRVGEHTVEQGAICLPNSICSEDIPIKKVIRHKRWSGNASEGYDIALVRLQRPIMLFSVSPLPQLGRLIPTFVTKQTFSQIGPWWWSSGQRARLLLRRSEFDSR